MNLIVLIATHNRVDITTRNIESLLGQSVKPRILIVCSTQDELSAYFKYAAIGEAVNCYVFKNNPLGAKWQSGVDRIESWDEIQTSIIHKSTLIVTGSDDILGDSFIENACRLVEHGNHFIGIRQWYQHRDGKAYKCQYLAKNNQPIGGGRVYSNDMLKAINYQVFDPTKDKHLDDLGWANAQKSGLKCLVLDEPEKEGLSIHAIKGNWPVMNPFTTKHPNIKLLGTCPSDKVLPNFFK